jgi:poly(3-hydroxybutyrate) depolymerase
VPFLEIHGTADQNVAWEYGERSIVDWRAFDRCTETSDIVPIGPVTTTSWLMCANDTRVQFVSIDGADHPWPSQRTATLDGLPISFAVDATEATWSFFSSVLPGQTASRPA